MDNNTNNPLQFWDNHIEELSISIEELITKIAKTHNVEGYDFTETIAEFGKHQALKRDVLREDLRCLVSDLRESQDKRNSARKNLIPPQV
jgi:hypothetical protein